MRPPYIHLAGDLSGWPPGTVPTPKMLRNLDQFSSELVNGEEGGTYAPESPLVIGTSTTSSATADVTLNAAACLLAGDVETVDGNAIGDENYIPGLVLEAGALPTFQTNRSRSVVVPFGFFTEFLNSYADLPFTHEIDPLTLGAKTISTSLTTPTILSVALPFNARHRGATIASVDFRFVVAGQRSAIPSNKPKVRVIRSSSSAIQNLHTTAGDYDANGWLNDAAATLSAYVNNNKTRTLSFVPNQNNVIDSLSYMYLAQFYVEGPMTGAVGNLYLSATVNLTTIASMQQE